MLNISIELAIFNSNYPTLLLIQETHEMKTLSAIILEFFFTLIVFFSISINILEEIMATCNYLVSRNKTADCHDLVGLIHNRSKTCERMLRLH